MNDLQKNETDEDYNKRLEKALKKDRLGGWPSIIGLAGTAALLLNMLFREWDDYIVIGQLDIYLWELCLFFLAVAIAFVPASLKDAEHLAKGLPRTPVRVFVRGIVIRFVIAGGILLVAHKIIDLIWTSHI